MTAANERGGGAVCSSATTKSSDYREQAQDNAAMLAVQAERVAIRYGLRRNIAAVIAQHAWCANG